MSKGMAQKVQLLAAIAHDPEFYILDEPFSGLDPVNQQVLEDMVREIAERGRTIIFSTHVMEHAERLCDRIILMAGGRVVFDGPTEEALAKAPRRMIVASENAGLEALVTPFTKSVTRAKDDSLALVLKDDADTQKVLEKCVAKKIKLTRFEPKPPTLHEAFVAMVGDDLLAEMELEAEGRAMTLPKINLRRTYLIARRDYLGYVKTWGFWISFFMPFIFGRIGDSVFACGY